MIKLVNEDENGAYLGVTPEFLKDFVLKENNPNFEVYDSRDGKRRYIVVKSSRLPDDEDAANGRYGINFHRAKPSPESAKHYYNQLLQRIISKQALSECAFAAATKEEYDIKSAIWDKFYTYVWSENYQSVWVNPHSGSVNRKPDDILPFPKLEMDNWVAGITAQCARRDRGGELKRTMISIHSYNWASAVLDLGGFGVNDGEKLANIAAKIESKYSDKVQPLAQACRQDLELKIMRWLEHIQKFRHTLRPEELPPDGIEQDVIRNAARGLKLYQREIKRYSLQEFREAMQSLTDTKVRVVSCNYIYSGVKISQQLQLKEKMNQGLLHGALQIEFMKYYLEHAPGLMADIVLDVKQELVK